MSAEAVGWVFRHSPYKGATFAVHLAIADSVNDQNADEFWMRQSQLAMKARTTRATVNAAISTMLDDAMLTLIERGSGGANRYRFLMPLIADVWGPMQRRVSREATPAVTTADMGVASDDRGVSSHTTQNPRSNPTPAQAEHSRAPSLVSDAFTEFWKLYPRKIAKPAAQRAWRKVIDPERVMTGLARWSAYWTARNEPQFVPHPATWLNEERWNDEPPPLPRTAGAAPKGPRWAPSADEDAAARAKPSGRVVDL